MKQIALWRVGAGLSVLAIAASAVLLLDDAKLRIPFMHGTAALSAAPLLLAGVAFLFAQPVIRPSLFELLKNILLAATFLLWGGIQFMPQNALSLRLGNLVIALYVLDLAWVILGTKISRERN